MKMTQTLSEVRGTLGGKTAHGLRKQKEEEKGGSKRLKSEGKATEGKL